MDEKERRRKRREYMRVWREANREKYREYQRSYYAAYTATPKARERNRERARTWARENLERSRQKSREWHARQPKKGRRSGTAHPNWKGDAVGYHALHTWVVRQKGKPSLCEVCGSTTARRFEWANTDHRYRRNLEDWVRMCTPCHRQHDYINGLSKKGGRRRH